MSRCRGWSSSSTSSQRSPRSCLTSSGASSASHSGDVRSGCIWCLRRSDPRAPSPPDIRANTRLRICLAVAREAESRDVLDSARALTISRNTPGRALVRAGAHELVEVQTARVAGPASQPLGVDSNDAVELVPLTAWGEDTPDATPANAPTELDLLVAAAIEAAALAAADRCAAVACRRLPMHLVTLAQLPVGRARSVAVGLRGPAAAAAQPPLEHRPRRGRAVARRGRRPQRTDGGAEPCDRLAATVGPDELHLYAIGHGPGWRNSLRCRTPVRWPTCARSSASTACSRSSAARPTGAHVGAGDADPAAGGHRRLGCVGRGDRRRRRGQMPGPGAAAAVTRPGGGAPGLLTSDRSGLSGRLSAGVRNRLLLASARRRRLRLDRDWPPGECRRRCRRAARFAPRTAHPCSSRSPTTDTRGRRGAGRPADHCRPAGSSPADASAAAHSRRGHGGSDRRCRRRRRKARRWSIRTRPAVRSSSPVRRGRGAAPRW